MSTQAITVLAMPLMLSGTVSANRFVTPLGAQAAADANTYGVARSSGVAGERVTINILGTSTVEAGAAIAANATVKSDASGRAIPWAASGAKVALALEAASAAGQMIEVLLIPNAA